MPELNFQVEGAKATAFSVAPALSFKLRVSSSNEQEQIRSIVLRCQIQIEAMWRAYTQEEQAQLRDLFGDKGRWRQTLRGLLWTHAAITVPAFCGETLVELPVPCTFDFNVAATKYFAGLFEGDVPLCLQFSGTVFYEENGSLQVTPIPWDREARFRLPVTMWKEMMEAYYPNTSWLCLRRDVFQKLYAYKMQHGLTSFEEALESILTAAEEVTRP
ncbi:MAG TPA: DUF6084 family protein [Candidatus Angelobacter sp.]|nr:DUF6084 family protein [Candidatus Angelobacter sp.]